ncbi:MAG: PAS domain S-box protein, partial [Acidimicrobiales bacterium]
MSLDASTEVPSLPPAFSVALLLAAVESSTDAIISKQLDGTIVSWNPAAQRCYGYQAGEAIGQNIAMIVPEQLRSELSMMISRLARGERINDLETVRIRRDGSEVDVSVTMWPVFDGSDRVIGATCITRDLSDRQRSEKFRSRLASIVESAEDAVISLDNNGYVISWNPSAERLFGYQAEEMLGRAYSDILEGDEFKDFEHLFALAMAGERVSQHETSRRARDGTTTEVSLSLAPMFAADGSIIGESAILHDISDRKKREREQEASRTLLERAQRVGRIGGWTAGVGANSPLTCTSETFRIFGIEARPDLTTADFYDRVHPDDLEQVRAAVQKAIESVGRYEFEHRFVRPDGTEGWVFEAGDVLADECGRPVELTGVVQDITERRETEERAKGVEHQLRMLAENSQDLIFRYRIVPPYRFEFVSPASLAITGYTPDELYADPELIDCLLDVDDRDLWLERVLSGHAEQADDLEIVRKDGSKIWVSQRVEPVLGPSGEVVAADGITRDISERKAAEQRLEYEVLHDPLTGLPNRELLIDRIGQALARASRDGAVVAVLFVDIDRFKLFNDMRGHERGDAVLVAVAARLAAHLRRGDTVGRFSGDEFVVVSEGLRVPTDAIKIAEHTLSSFSTPFILAGEEVHVTASIGLAISQEGESAD